MSFYQCCNSVFRLVQTSDLPGQFISRRQTETEQFWWTKPGLAEIPVGDLFIFIACNQHIYPHHHHQSQLGYQLSRSTWIDTPALASIVQGGNSFSFAWAKIKIVRQEYKICINRRLWNSEIYLICYLHSTVQLKSVFFLVQKKIVDMILDIIDVKWY